MDFADDGAQRFLSVSFRSGKKLTAWTMRNTLGKLIKASGRKIREHVNTGEQSMKRLSRKELAMQSVEVNNDTVAEFREYAKKYHANFTFVQQKNDPTQYVLFFPQRDLDKIVAASRDYLKDTSITHDNLTEKLEKARMESVRVNQSKAKEHEKARKQERRQERGTREQ